MKRPLKIQKIPLDTLINLLIELYEKGVDYVDLFSNSDDPKQDKLIILTKDEYINPTFLETGVRPDIVDNGEDEGYDDDDEDSDESLPPKSPSLIETKKLTDEDINDLI